MDPSRHPRVLVGAPPNIKAIVAEMKSGKRLVKPPESDSFSVAKKPKPMPLPKPRHLVKPPIKPKPRQYHPLPSAGQHPGMGEQVTTVSGEPTRMTTSPQQKRRSLQRNSPQVGTLWTKVDDKKEGIMDNGGKPAVMKKPVIMKLSNGKKKQLTRKESQASIVSGCSVTSGRSDEAIKDNEFESEVNNLSQGNYSGTTVDEKWNQEVVVIEGGARERIDNTTGDNIYDTTLNEPRLHLARSQSAESVLQHGPKNDDSGIQASEPVAASRVPFDQTCPDTSVYGYSSNCSITEDEPEDWGSGDPVSVIPRPDSSPVGTLGIIRKGRKAVRGGKMPNRVQGSSEVESPYMPQKQRDIGKQFMGIFQKRFSSEETLSAKEVENLRHEIDSQSRNFNLSNSPVGENQCKKKEKKERVKKVKKRLKFGKLKDKLKFGGSSMEEETPPLERQWEDGLDSTSDSDFSDGDYFSDIDDYVGECKSEDEQDMGSMPTPPKSSPHRMERSYEIIDIDPSGGHPKVILESRTPPVAAERRPPRVDANSQETGVSGEQDTVVNTPMTRTESHSELENWRIYESCPCDDDEDNDHEEEEDKCNVTVGEVDGEDEGGPDGQGRFPHSPSDQFGGVDSDDGSDGGDYEDVAQEEPSSEDEGTADAQCPPNFKSRSDNAISKITEAADHPNTPQVGADEMSSHNGIYISSWIAQEPAVSRSVEDHVYDSTPSSKTKIAYRYTQVDKISQQQGRGLFVIGEGEFVEDLQGLSLGSTRDEETEEENGDCDDGASTSSGDSVGVAYSKEEEEMNGPGITRGGSCGRYTRDGKSGAVFSFAHDLPDSQPWNEETGTSSCLSPDFEKKGPKLPPRMSTPDNRRHSSDYQLVHLPAQEEMDMTSNTEKDYGLPLYQRYTEGLQRKESLLLLHCKDEEKRKHIMENASRSNRFWDSDSGNSGDSGALLEGPENGMENYSDWGTSDYGMIVPEEKAVDEDFYEPLAYEDYLEEKRKKLFPLWRDQEEIISSGLLSQLTPREQDLQEALYEIITSEDSYLRSVQLVTNHFMMSQSLWDLLGRSDHHTLFSNIVAVRDASQRLCDDLSAHHRRSFLLRDVPRIIHDHLWDFECYIPYCGNNQHQVDLMNKIKKQPEIKAEIHRLEKHPDCQHLDLMSFLMLPFQRITRLPLLIKAVVERSSSQLAEDANLVMAELTELVKRCNNNARRMEEIKELSLVIASLDHKPGVKHVELSQNAVVKKKGTIGMLRWEVGRLGRRKIGIKKKVLIVTTEKVIIAKERIRGDQKRFEVQDWCMTNRVTTEDITDEQKEEMFPSGLPPDACSIFRLTFLENHRREVEEYDLCTQKESDKERWITALSTSSWGENGEKIYDVLDCPLVFCIKAISKSEDIDELDLQLYEKLHVLKKMDDGWWEGRRLRDNKVGWFPGSHVEELESDHRRAKRLKEIHLQGTHGRDYSLWAQ